MAQCRSTLVPEGSAPRSSCSIKLLQLRHLAIYFFGLSRSHPSILANLPRTLGWLSARDFLQAYCKAKKEKKNCQLSCKRGNTYLLWRKRWRTGACTLIFLPKFRLIFFFRYLESFCFLSSVFRSLMVTSLSQDDWTFAAFTGRGVLVPRFCEKIQVVSTIAELVKNSINFALFLHLQV
jgi:hypothetical protein